MMKKIICLCLCLFQCGFGDENYFSYLKQLDRPNGNYLEGEIEIVVDPAGISKIQKIQENRLVNKGFSATQAAEFSRIGVVNEDQYWIWLRDAVYFPKGIPGTYDRLIWKSELKNKAPGVAVMPILPSGNIVLVLNYRHATRSWELELPRGVINAQESFEQAATRELKEETGFIPSCVTFLGDMATDSGVLSSVIPVYFGKISAKEESNPEYSEAIADVISFSKDELKAGFINGYLEVTVEGKKKQVPLRDAFLTFALYQAAIRGLL